MHPRDRIKLGKMTHPVRGFLHGGAAVVAIVGTVFLMVLAPNLRRSLSLMVFGLGLVTLYTVSALYHSIPWGEKWKSRLRRMDHSAIYILIAATFTPVAIHVLDGWLRWGTLAVQWGIVAIGVTHKLASRDPGHKFSVAMQTTQGWLALLLLVPLFQAIPWPGVFLIALGGVFYTVGMVVLVTNWPRLWPRVFSYHEVFHMFVIAASAVHFAAILRYVALPAIV